MTRVSNSALIPYIPLDRDSKTPLYTQIYAAIHEAILSGRLAPGTQLPATRTLAAELQISRIPAVNAFDQLKAEGYLEGRSGSGTYVADPTPDAQVSPIRWLHPGPSDGATSDSADAPSQGSNRRPGAFAIDIPSVDHFPRDVFSRLIRRHAAKLDEISGDGNPDPAGSYRLREALAEYLRAARGVRCDAKQILIVSGGTMAVTISTMALTTSESTVCIEEPSHPRVREVMQATSATLIPVAVDAEGINVAALSRLGDAVRLVHVTTSPQYPLGTSMSIPRRIALSDWAHRHGAWIIEGEYHAPFRYGGRPFASLQGMDTDGRVIFAGSFSSVLFPALRLGYVIAPPDLVGDFLRIRQTIDRYSPLLYQCVLADFIKEGHFTRYLRRMRGVYLARRNALIQALHSDASDVLSLGVADGGLHVVAFLPPGINDQEVVRHASAKGLTPTALSTCYTTNASRSGLLLSFAGSDELVLKEAVQDLASVIRELR